MNKFVLNFRSLFLVSLLTILSFTACKKDDKIDPKTITQTVIDDPNFSFLEAAIVKASTVEDLAGLLSSSTTAGFTVFAPTNAAFQAAGFATEAAVSAADAATLRDILKYHVLATKVTSTQIVTGPVTTALGRNIFLSTSGGVFINPSNPNFAANASLGAPLGTTGNIQVTTADVQASNGVIHAVNKVILPPPTIENMARLYAAQSTPEFSNLVNALVATSLAPSGPLNGAGPFTVFAPTNAAFNAITATTNALTTPQLSTVLRYHVYSGSVFSTQLAAGNIAMLAGGNLSVITSPSAAVKANSTGAATVTLGPTGLNVVCSNGVIHVVGTVLIPTL